MRGTISAENVAVLSCTLVAAALPLLILVFGVPISHPDVETFARLHLHPAFEARVALTFAYFPAVIALHWLICPKEQSARRWYLLGFCLFLLGNGIDAAYRAVQYFVVHGSWADDVLSKGGGNAAAAKILHFNEYARGIGFSFALFFAAGRLVMGMALLAARTRFAIVAGAAIILNGLWNLATVLSVWPAFAVLAALSDFYLWPWLAAILAAGALGWRGHEEARAAA